MPFVGNAEEVRLLVAGFALLQALNRLFGESKPGDGRPALQQLLLQNYILADVLEGHIRLLSRMSFQSVKDAFDQRKFHRNAVVDAAQAKER